jgi:hypothetical protein
MPRTQEVPLAFTNLAGLDNGKIDLLHKRLEAELSETPILYGTP